ncbi:unnamed protein product [Boreogadus saida]
MVCLFPCLVLVCYLFYFGIGLVSPHVRFPSCVITAPALMCLSCYSLRALCVFGI